jgi:hypothetical protein
MKKRECDFERLKSGRRRSIEFETDFERRGQMKMIKLRFGLVIGLALMCGVGRAAEEREWLTNEEMGEQIFSRKVTLSKEAISKTLALIETLKEDEKGRAKDLAEKLRTKPESITIMDVASLVSVEKKEMSWFYNLIATNQDPVVRFFGLMPQVVVLKEESAAQSVNELGHPKTPQKDQLLLDNCLHGIGIDPREDNAKTIFEFLSTMRDESHPAIGSVAKDFKAPALDGKMVRLSDFKGKPVFLHFWSTDCGPCVAEFPNLQNTSTK